MRWWGGVGGSEGRSGKRVGRGKCEVSDQGQAREAGGTNSIKGRKGVLGPEAEQTGRGRLRWSVGHGCGIDPILALTASSKGIGGLHRDSISKFRGIWYCRSALGRELLRATGKCDEIDAPAVKTGLR